MAHLNKFKTIDGLNESQFNAEPGRVNQILVLVEGTAKAGQTGTNADVGRIEITRNGEPIINRDFSHFCDMADIRGGANVFNSAEAGDFEASCVIPFFEKGHPNALNIRTDEELNVRFIPNDDGTVFASLDVEFRQEMVSIEERYNYLILGNDLSLASAATAKGFTLNRKNVSALYLDDVDDTVKSLSFESNQGTVVSVSSWLALQAYTNYNNLIEDGSFDIVEIENHTPGVPGSTLNRNNKLILTTSGAGDVDVTVCQMMWHDN